MNSSTKEFIFECFMLLTMPIWVIVGIVMLSFLLPIAIVYIIIKYAIKLFSPNSADRIDKLIKGYVDDTIDFFVDLKEITKSFLLTCWDWIKKILKVIIVIILLLGFIILDFQNCEGGRYYDDDEFFDDAHRPDRF